jgi:hypothetical protein
MKKPKRVVVIADTHCGHKFGLTPPDWWTDVQSTTDRQQKQISFQRAMWEFYADEIAKLKPIDILIVNGDCIEGKGDRTGGIELVTSDRLEQVRMAAAVINEAEAPTVRITYGTSYHTGKDEDFESSLPEYVKGGDCRVEGHLFLNINGCHFDVKHKIGRSVIPHGRVTPLQRAAVWNAMWAIRDRQPRADVIIRSHVHYYEKWDNDIFMGIITPALQYNTNYGIRECEGVVNVGFLMFDVRGKGDFTEKCILAKFDALKVRAESL